MKPKTANKRYIVAIMSMGMAYLASVFGVSFMEDHVADGSVMGIALALIPGLFILGMIWSIWRYMTETDEVTRHDHTLAMQAGLYAILGISGVWGLVELFNDDMPRLPVFYMFPAFFLIFGLVSGVKFKRWC